MPWQRGLVVLSADPITFGHLDLIDQALAQCAELVVLVTVNLEKVDAYLFPLEERSEMAHAALRERFGDDHRLHFVGGRYQAVDVFLVYDCDIIIRGLRHERERAYEESILTEFKSALPALNTLLLLARAGFEGISSTEAKRVSLEDPNQLHQYVPTFVATRLRQRHTQKEYAHAHR